MALLNRSRGSSALSGDPVEFAAKCWGGRGNKTRLFRSGENVRRVRVRLGLGGFGGLLVLVFLLAGGLAGLALGQFGQFAQFNNRGAPPFDPNSSGPAAKHLQIAADHARGGHWSEAVQMYQKVIEQFGERVTVLPAEGALAGPGAGAATRASSCSMSTIAGTATGRSRSCRRRRERFIADGWTGRQSAGFARGRAGAT